MSATRTNSLLNAENRTFTYAPEGHEIVKNLWKNRSLHPTETHMTIAAKIATVIAATITLFSQDLTIIFNDALQSETTSHILAIPFIFAYLIYRKRKMLRAVIPLDTQNQPKHTKHLPTIAGILLSTTAILLYWYGSYTFTPLEYHILALPIFTAGLTLIMFNHQTLRQLAFPIAFLILLMPPPSDILYGLGATLSVISAEASNTIINALGIHSTLSSEYGNPVIHVQTADGATIPFAVNIACSGVYSLIGFLIFAVFIAYIIRDKPWKKATIFPIGLLLIYLLNIARITIILLIGYRYGEETALQIFHLLGGWVLIFLGTIILLITLEKILKTRISIKSTASTQCPQCNPKPSKHPQNFCLTCARLLRYSKVKLKRWDIAKIAATALTVALLLSIQAPVFALTQGPAEIIIQAPTGEQATTQILPQIQEYTLKFVYRDRNFERKAKQDASLVYAYIPNNKTKDTIWITLEIASTISSLHRWEVCLITWRLAHGYQPKVTPLDSRDIQILENPPIIARYFAFQYIKTNQTQVVLYWYERSAFQTNTTSEQKHVKISTIAYLNSPENIPQIEDQLATIARAIAQYWQPIKTWTQIAILISQSGDKLTAITTGLLILVVAIFVLERKKERKVNANAYQKLSKPNKEIINIIHETEKTTTPTLNNIAITHRNTTRKPINKEKLLHTLTEIEQTGIIKSEVANKEDEPIQIWKTTMSFAKTSKT